MKKIYYLLSIALVAVFMSCTVSRSYAQPGYSDSYYDNGPGGVTYQQFYDELSPYGNWISYPGYGYVWSPYDAGFRPYGSNGHWVYSTFGWTWVSGYRWGWAPFHYGRWFLDVRFGWLWIPGYQWAPAWVAWRGGGGYYGWAPLGPGMSINISIGSIPGNYWSYVPGRYMGHRNMSRYYVRNNTTIINKTTIINNNYYNDNRTINYNSGPQVRDVERYTNSRIAPVRVVNRSTPGNSNVNNNQLTIYRPQVRQGNTEARPSKIVSEPVRNTGSRNAPVRQLNEGTAAGSGFQSNGISQPRTLNRADLSADNDNVSRPMRRIDDNGNGGVTNEAPARRSPNVQSPAPQRGEINNGSNNSPIRELNRPSERRQQPQMNERPAMESGRPVHIAPRREMINERPASREMRSAPVERVQPRSSESRAPQGVRSESRRQAPVRESQRSESKRPVRRF